MNLFSGSLVPGIDNPAKTITDKQSEKKLAVVGGIHNWNFLIEYFHDGTYINCIYQITNCTVLKAYA